MGDKTNEIEDSIKIILLGESGVGKTNLINVFFGFGFDKNTETTLSSYCYDGEFQHKNKTYSYSIWDTAGQEKYHSLTKIFLNEAKIAFIIYAINDKASYEKIDFWYNLVKESCGNIVIAIIGNKKDLYEEEQVNEEDAIKKAKSLNATFGLTSALEDDTGFDEIINKVLKKYIEDQGESTENQVFSSNLKLSLRDTIKSTKSEDSSKKKKKLC